MKRALLVGLTVGALMTAAAGCGGDPISALFFGDDGVTPRLSELTFNGQAPDSTLVLLMSVHFEDDDGDLGDGSLETFINGTTTSAGPIQFLSMFVQNDVALDATAGDLEFVLELAFDEDEADWPKEGSSFRLGARASDAAGNVSATEEVTLSLSYE
jgi:hypothetical protein